MKARKHLLDAPRLIEIADRAQELANCAFREPEAYRIAGRVIRSRIHLELGNIATEADTGALAEAHVHLAKAGDDPYAAHPAHFFLLQCATQIVSCRLWEDCWNEKHPDRVGEAWDGEDFALMSVWREKVRAMIKQCDQNPVFGMTMKQYAAELIDAGASEEVVAGLVVWMSEVMYEEGASA
jgi:hypothetical protein